MEPWRINTIKIYKLLAGPGAKHSSFFYSQKGLSLGFRHRAGWAGREKGGVDRQSTPRTGELTSLRTDRPGHGGKGFKMRQMEDDIENCLSAALLALFL